MQVAPLPLNSHGRTGITLMEVLVSIGILAIGLTSAMSLIPAGKSEAGKALIYDRAATMAMNGLSDAVTFGLTRADSIVISNTAAATIVFDPANVIPWDTTFSGTATVGRLKSDGVLATRTVTSLAPLGVEKLFTQSRDDVAYNRPVTDDAIPSNGFINGIRGFEGRMTSVIALTGSGAAPVTAGEFATLSVIMFHNRDTLTPPLEASLTAAGLVTVAALPTGRTLKSILRPGTVVFYEDPDIHGLRFAQLGMAAVDTQAGNAFVTFAGRANTFPPPATIYVCVDSVGLAEKTVSLEGPGPYGQ